MSHEDSKQQPKSIQGVNKLNLLTPEELAQLQEEGKTALLSALENGNMVAEAWLASWRNQPADVAESAQEQATAIQASILSAPPEQASLYQWCGFPTDMTRVSPFHPMQVNELGDRPFLRDYLISSGSWGEINYTGPKLSTYEEDALLALLAILETVTKYRKETTLEDKKTYTYKGPFLPLWRLMYGDTTKAGKPKKPSKQDYKRLVSSLELLAVAGVKLSLASRTKTGKKKTRYTTLSSMLSNVSWDEDKKELSATINPFFYETYYAGSVTYLDVQRRMGLSGAIAKSLYRFIQSHQKGEWAGHFLTLAQVLNMDLEQPQKEVKRVLKKGINELIKQGILTKKSAIQKNDIATLFRGQKTLPPPSKKTAKKQLKK